jgi:glycosyltransferase involved in cell wall biosynthesis
VLRVLAVIPSGFCFGLQNVTLSFFSRLAEQLDPLFLLTRWTDGEFAGRLDELHIPYEYSWLGMFSRKLDPRNLKMTLHCASKMPLLYRDYVKIVRSFKPDLIYTANHHEVLLLLPLLKVMNVPVVCHVHDPPPLAPFYRAMYRTIDSQIDRFITISDSVSERTKQLGINAEKVSVLHNGIDLTAFPFYENRLTTFQEKYSWPADSVIVGITGQILENKGHGDLLEAMSLVRNHNDKVRLVIGGRQNGPYFEELKKRLNDKRLNDVVHFSGWQACASDFFSGLDIFVLASRHEEGFGLVVAEAMATGRPVIATDSGGAREVLVDKQTGILVEKANPNELAEAILLMAATPELRKRMGNEGRRRAELCFDMSKQAQRLKTILTSVGNHQ